MAATSTPMASSISVSRSIARSHQSIVPLVSCSSAAPMTTSSSSRFALGSHACSEMNASKRSSSRWSAVAPLSAARSSGLAAAAACSGPRRAQFCGLRLTQRNGAGEGGLAGSSVGQRRGASSRRQQGVTANWKQEVLWTDVTLTEVKPAANQLFSITADISSIPELKEGYTKPGQFVQVKVGDSKPAFLAIASPPELAGNGVFEFLVKDVEGSTAALLCKQQAAAVVQMSQVMGKGFNAALLSPPQAFSSILIFATGSGISPIRALIEDGCLQASERLDVRLFFGATDLTSMAYQDRFESWEASGVRVIPVLSQPSAGWEGETGFVQAAYSRSQPVADAAKTGAFLCGQKEMAEEVTSILTAQGILKENILLNF